MTIDQFEAVVLNQKPADKPWTPVTPYDFDTRKEIEGPHPQLIKDVFQPSLVLDVGCGPDAILVRLLADVGVPALGMDPQIAANPIDRRLVRGSITDPWIQAPEETPVADLVICREVLEHLTAREIRIAITNLCKLTKRYVYITTRFTEGESLLAMDTKDDLDPTHISLLTKDFLRALLVLEGFRRCAAIEEIIDWKKLGRCLVYERVA